MRLSTVVLLALIVLGVFAGWWWLTWHALGVVAPATLDWPLWVKAVLTLNFMSLAEGLRLNFKSRQRW